MRSLAFGLLLLAAGAASADVLVIRDATVIVGSGKTLARATVVVKDGKIVAVGEKATVPPLARVLDGSGLTIAPGLVCVASRSGLSTGRVTRASTEVRIRRIDDVDPWEPGWKAAREAGVTTIGLVPLALGVGGHGAIVKPVPGDRKTMTVRGDAPLVLGFLPGTSNVQAFRGGFDRAKKWIAADEAHRKGLEAKAAAEKAAKEKAATPTSKPPAGKPVPKPAPAPSPKAAPAPSSKAPTAEPSPRPTPPAPKPAPASGKPKSPTVPPKPAEDPRVMPFVRALRGEIPCFVRVSRPMGGQLASGSLAHLLPILEDLGLRPVLVLDGASAVRNVAVLAKAKLPVVVMVSLAADPLTGRWVNAARVLHEAKIPFALTATGPKNDFFVGMRHRLALLVRAGLPRDAAFAAVTVSPAKLLGLEKRVGSIQPGRDADLVLYDGDPLDPLARVVRVIVGGETVHERPEAK